MITINKNKNQVKMNQLCNYEIAKNIFEILKYWIILEMMGYYYRFWLCLDIIITYENKHTNVNNDSIYIYIYIYVCVCVCVCVCGLSSDQYQYYYWRFCESFKKNF